MTPTNQINNLKLRLLKNDREIDWEEELCFAIKNIDYEAIKFVIKWAYQGYGYEWDVVMKCAIETGSIEMINLINDEAEKNEPGEPFDWESYIYDAILNEDPKLIPFFKEKGGDDLESFDWNCGMLFAMENNKEKMVQYMIEQGRKEDPNYKFDWDSAMCNAAECDNVDMVYYTIEQGRKEELNYKFPFTGACEDKHLVEYTNDSNYKFDWGTGLCAASENGNKQLVEYMIKQGNNSNYKFDWDLAIECCDNDELAEFIKSKRN